MALSLSNMDKHTEMPNAVSLADGKSPAMDLNADADVVEVVVVDNGGGISNSQAASKNSDDRTKGTWSREEDALLSRRVSKFGAMNWSMIAEGIPGRSGKSCRLRWCNQLDPAVKRKPFTGIISFPILFFIYLYAYIIIWSDCT